MLPLPSGIGVMAVSPEPTASEESGGGSGAPASVAPDRLRDRIQRRLHAVVTGPSGRRRRWTPIGLTAFAISIALVVSGGLVTDRLLGAPSLPDGGAWRALGWALVLLGLGLCGWCVSLFARARGTPVPANPPDDLVQRGPYAWVRNPMLGGVFTALFGVGVLLRSPSTLLLWIPAYVLVHVLELKWVEEPELERRFGVAYRAYRDAAPMFFPRLWRRP